jgi:hypothetical protein
MRSAAAIILILAASTLLEAQEDFLTWAAQRAEAVGKAAYVQGRVGGMFDMRMLKTERSYNYKLAATLMTPAVIRATARRLQLSQRLTAAETMALVAQAERDPGMVVMIEVDPREGSGIIPNDWTAILQPIVNGGAGRSVRGVNTPKLRDVQALAGVLRRNYDYERFWVVFPSSLDDGSPALPKASSEVELIVRILDREGAVRWPMPVINSRFPEH